LTTSASTRTPPLPLMPWSLPRRPPPTCHRRPAGPGLALAAVVITLLIVAAVAVRRRRVPVLPVEKSTRATIPTTPEPAVAGPEVVAEAEAITAEAAAAGKRDGALL
jgi:hypothetical protein